MSTGATPVHIARFTGWNGRVDDEDDPACVPQGGASIDIVGPELERCSVLADRLARLLLPDGLFS